MSRSLILGVLLIISLTNSRSFGLSIANTISPAIPETNTSSLEILLKVYRNLYTIENIKIGPDIWFGHQTVLDKTIVETNPFFTGVF